MNEAAAETYVPLIRELHLLVDDGYTPRVTLGVTPVLSEMLVHPKFVEGFKAYLEEKVQAAIRDRDQFKSENFEVRAKTADFWVEFYERVRDHFTGRCGESIPGALRELQDRGVVEVITCAATHGYFPLLTRDSSIDAQIKAAIASYERIYGRKPAGFWLPECAYRPGYEWKNPFAPEEPARYRRGVEWYLAANGLKYFFVDTHLTMGGLAQGVYAARFALLKELWKQFSDSYEPVEPKEGRTPYEPYLIHSREPISPVAFFTRDERTGILVWSGEHGYPGDGTYLDFHKKHFPGGLRYWKVTAAKLDLGAKMEYYLDDVPPRLDENASHFVNTVKDILREHREQRKRPGIVVAMYDTELFGHWWFEGPWWISRVLRWLEDDPDVELTTAGRFLEQYPPVEQVSLPEGSWGQGGGHWVWLNSWTTWTWERVAECESEMEELASRHAASSDPTMVRLLRQAARELLLLQASDWQFLMTTWSARDYAEARVATHYENFKRLAEAARALAARGSLGGGELELLERLERDDGPFPGVDPAWWRPVEY